MRQEASSLNFQNIWQSKLQINLIRRNKKGHYILSKGIVSQDDLTVFNTHLPNSDVLYFLREFTAKAQINIDPLIVDDFNTPFSPVDVWSRQKVYKK